MRFSMKMKSMVWSIPKGARHTVTYTWYFRNQLSKLVGITGNPSVTA
jgi:hypothetical protein